MRIDPSNTSLHGQLTNEFQNGASISRTYDALGRLGGVGFNAEAQSRRGFEYQYLAGSDPRVNEYWRRSWKSHRFRLVKTHERRHRTHAKSNYDLSVNFLKGVSKNKYAEEADRLSAAKYYFDRAVFFFVNQDAVDGGKVERGEL